MKRKVYLTKIENQREAKALALISVKHLMSLVLTLVFCLFFAACSKKDSINVPDPGKPPTTTTPVNTIYPDFGVLSRGYDITGMYADNTAMRALVIDNRIMYDKYQNRVLLDKLNDQGNSSLAGENASSFSKAISTKLKVSFGLGLFKASVSRFDSLAFRSDYVYAGASMYIKRRHLKLNAPLELLQQSLTKEFQEDVQNQTPAYIVAHYGTSVIVEAIMGAKLEAIYRARTSSTDRKGAASGGLSSAIEKIFDVDFSPGTNQSSSQLNSNQQFSYRAVGGNGSANLTGDLNLGTTVPSKISTAVWQNSIADDNIQLIDFGADDALISIADLVSDTKKGTDLRNYINQYLLANQVQLVEAPSLIYQYQDNSNSNHAWSLQQAPALFGRFTLQGAAGFMAYDKAVNGALPVYQWYSPAKGEFILSRDNNANLPGYTNMGIVFYAFDKQVPGSVPIFEFKYEAKIHKTWYYSRLYTTTTTNPGQDWSYTELPFYAFIQ